MVLGAGVIQIPNNCAVGVGVCRLYFGVTDFVTAGKIDFANQDCKLLAEHFEVCDLLHKNRWGPVYFWRVCFHVVAVVVRQDCKRVFSEEI